VAAAEDCPGECIFLEAMEVPLDGGEDSIAV
jgi:hypothetical protein